MNLSPPVYQLLSAITGGAKDGQFDIHALPETFGVAAGFPNHFTAGRPFGHEFTTHTETTGNI